MGIFFDIVAGVRSTLAGLRVTLPYITRKPVTTMYPHERLELPERSRNRLYVDMDDCIGCDQCARACPVDCIQIETVKAVEGDMPGLTSNGKKKALWVTRFDIDIAKCCFCNLCTFPCPTECIVMTDVYEFAEEERDRLIYNFVTLTPEEIAEKIARAQEAEAALAARKASARAAAASAPSPAPSSAAQAQPGIAGVDDPEKAAKLAALQAKMAEARARREAGGDPATIEVSREAPDAPVATSTDASPAARGVSGSGEEEKARRIAELEAKLAEARARRDAAAREAGGGKGAESGTSRIISGGLAGASAYTARAVAPSQHGGPLAQVPGARQQTPSVPVKPAMPSEPSAPAEPSVPAEPSAPAEQDEEKARRIAELQAKIAEAKRKREQQ